jgi:hypothetical protein
MRQLAAFVLVSLAMQMIATMDDVKGLDVQAHSDGSQYMVTVTADKEYEGDQAIVTIYYHVPTPPGLYPQDGENHELLIHKTESAELLPGVTIGVAGVHVGADKVKWFDVTIVKPVKKARFDTAAAKLTWY